MSIHCQNTAKYDFFTTLLALLQGVCVYVCVVRGGGGTELYMLIRSKLSVNIFQSKGSRSCPKNISDSPDYTDLVYSQSG